MILPFMPIWFVDVGGSILMIVLSIGSLMSALRLRHKEHDNIIWTYLVWVCYALMVFAFSRSAGHILKQALILTGRQEVWGSIRPYSGAVNTFSFMVVGSVTLFFERTWAIYRGIVKDRQELEATHQKLLYLNQNLERLVEDRTQALALSEHQYRRIFEESKDMILVTRKDSCILDINPAGLEMLGLKSLDEGGSGYQFSSYLKDAQDWTTLLDKIERQGFISSTELDLKVADGGRKRVLLSGGLAEDLTGQEGTIHFVVKDIEQQHLMREQMAQADKLASIGELSSGIAHEINNPLGIILGYTQLMLRDEPAASDRTSDLKTIEKQVRHCKSIVEDLLNFARMSAPKKEMSDIHKIIDDVIHFIRQHSKLDGIEIHTVYDRQIGPLFLDSKKISQVLINLLMNAIYAIGREGDISVTTAVADGGRKACIQVQDTGIGIQTNDLARIFDPFFTTKPTGQGTGLGLSVSYGIIKNHGGDIRVESAPGRGAMFTILLPVPDALNGR
jgi:two-component system, NtrC family, sensor kinase